MACVTLSIRDVASYSSLQLTSQLLCGNATMGASSSAVYPYYVAVIGTYVCTVSE